MKSVEFCYWLQGYFELVAPDGKAALPMTVEQVDIVRKHLALVFTHEIDPSYPTDQQAKLNALHVGKEIDIGPLHSPFDTGSGDNKLTRTLGSWRWHRHT